jgi:hypothetical protein
MAGAFGFFKIFPQKLDVSLYAILCILLRKKVKSNVQDQGNQKTI